MNDIENSLRTMEILEAIMHTLDEIGAPMEDEGSNKLNLHGRLIDWLGGRRAPRHTGASEVCVVRHVPIHGTDVEVWIKRWRDENKGTFEEIGALRCAVYMAIDDILNDYRMHAATGTLLDEDTCEP